jgi:hypothetical protein
MKKGDSIFDSFFSGFKFVFSNQVMLAAMSLDMFAVLFGGAVALLPVFAKEVLQVLPWQQSFLSCRENATSEPAPLEKALPASYF